MVRLAVSPKGSHLGINLKAIWLTGYSVWFDLGGLKGNLYREKSICVCIIWTPLCNHAATQDITLHYSFNTCLASVALSVLCVKNFMIMTGFLLVWQQYQSQVKIPGLPGQSTSYGMSFWCVQSSNPNRLSLFYLFEFDQVSFVLYLSFLIRTSERYSASNILGRLRLFLLLFLGVWSFNSSSLS